MGILVRLLFTAVAGLITFLTKKVPWVSIIGGIGTFLGAILTFLQIMKELKYLGWIS